MLALKSTRLSQGGALSIKPGTPFFNNLTCAWTGDDNFLFGPTKTYVISSDISISKFGVGKECPSPQTNNGRLPNGSFGETSENTCIALIRVPSGAGRNIAAGPHPRAIQFRTNNGTDLQLIQKAVAVRITAAGVLSAGEFCVVAATRGPSGSAIYKNGARVGTGVGWSTVTSGEPALFQDGTGSGFFAGGAIYGFFAFNTVLSDSAIASLSANPWQIFR
jgi:hypothetical protein